MALSGVRSSWDMFARKLRLVPGSPLRAPVQAGVVDRQGRLGREGLEQGDDLGREGAGRPSRHHQPAEDAILAQRAGRPAPSAGPSASSPLADRRIEQVGAGDVRRPGTAHARRPPVRRRSRRGGSGPPGGVATISSGIRRRRGPRRRPRPRRTRRRRRRRRRPGGWRWRRSSSAPPGGRATRRPPGRPRRAPAARRRESWSSWNSRAFSMAMTAWSANVSNERDLLLGERLDLGLASDERADRRCPRGAAGRRATVRYPPAPLQVAVLRYSGIGQHVGDVDGPPLQGSPAASAEPRPMGECSAGCASA